MVSFITFRPRTIFTWKWFLLWFMVFWFAFIIGANATAALSIGLIFLMPYEIASWYELGFFITVDGIFVFGLMFSGLPLLRGNYFIRRSLPDPGKGFIVEAGANTHIKSKILLRAMWDNDFGLLSITEDYLSYTGDRLECLLYRHDVANVELIKAEPWGVLGKSIVLHLDPPLSDVSTLRLDSRMGLGLLSNRDHNARFIHGIEKWWKGNRKDEIRPEGAL